MEPYKPAEDSFFFVKYLREYLSQGKGQKIESYCDMGTGTGILSKTAAKFLDKKNILATDINPKAIQFVKEKGFNAVQSDLFESVDSPTQGVPLARGKKFDLITFNAPYLPQDEREPKSSQLATTGGKKGDEISVRFIQEAKKHLKNDGTILLLISSLTPRGKLEELGGEIVRKKKLWMEELLILKFR